MSSHFQRINKLDRDFISVPEIPRDIAFIPSIPTGGKDGGHPE